MYDIIRIFQYFITFFINMTKSFKNHVFYFTTSASLSQKNLLKNFWKDWTKFSKISSISMAFKKDISILSHTAKKLQARQYLQNCLFK